MRSGKHFKTSDSKRMEYFNNHNAGEFWHQFNLKDNRVEKCQNTKFLGYSPEEWQDQYLNKIVGVYKDMYLKFRTTFWKVLYNKSQLFRYGNRLSYSISFPVFCSNEKRIAQIHEKSFCIEYDEKLKSARRIISFFSQINFCQQPFPLFNLSPFLLVNNGQDESLFECEELLKNALGGNFIFDLEIIDDKGKVIRFNAMEIRCAELLYQGKKAGAIADQLGKSKNDVNYYNRKLLEKARLLFKHSKFRDAKAVAEFLAQNRLI